MTPGITDKQESLPGTLSNATQTGNLPFTTYPFTFEPIQGFIGTSAPKPSLPPGKVEVGLHVYDLVVLSPKNMDSLANEGHILKPGESAAGLTFCSTYMIFIASGQDEWDMRDSVVHEILHAITCDDGGRAKSFNSKSEKNHEGIYYLSPRLTFVLIHNPALTMWLAHDAIAEHHRLDEWTQDEMEPPALDIEEDLPEDLKK